MELIPTNIEQRLPPLYATEHVKLGDKIVHVKLFTPWTNWTWFVIEYNPETRICWGLVEGHETEWGYFSLDEIEAVEGRGGLRIERDIHFSVSSVRRLVEQGEIRGLV
ncbi:DUF2958 domain-containing protein [Planctomycetales bacterium ZRK34]|nr:DUF2958 domain-containing protein [Planctomycetales bacterium ZRK34]